MDISAALAALAEPAQTHRLIRLQAPLAGLVPERFSGQESVCAPFRFEIDCLATSAFLPVEDLLEQPLILELARADGGLRRWHGLCTGVDSLGGDGGLARYRLVMEPWTALLGLRRNAVIFQDMDVRAICTQVFADYPQASYRFDVAANLPVPAITTQYRETDAQFVTRLLANAGLAWRYEQAQDGEAAHTLVVFDPQAELADTGTLRFHRADYAEAEDAITAFGEQRRIAPNAAVVASWHSEQVGAVSGQASAEEPELPALEIFVAPRSGALPTGEQAAAAAQARLDALRLTRRVHAGAGSGRQLQAGATFALAAHDRFGGQRFVPLSVMHVAANNLGSGVVDLLDAPDLERGSYRNRFVAVPEGTPLRALPVDRPTAPGLQTARVVGLPEAAVTANRDHQVRIQFDWQRGAVPNAGGLAGEEAARDHAPGDATSGTWVPVAEAVAGPNWGSHFLPRVGAEVLVAFQQGDIDQPRVVGQLYNGEVAPPFGGDVDSGQPGVLSGLHSTAHDGSGHQQWLLDDTPGQLRTRLHTSLADSRLELGYLVEHADTRRGALRGQGFELATQGWGQVHAAQGLLLSTTARQGAVSTAQDASEAVAQLKGAERTVQALADTLVQQQVPTLQSGENLVALRESIDPDADGQYGGSVNGQSAFKPGAGRAPGDAPVEALAQPRLLAESPDRIALASANSGVAYAGGALHWTVQDDAHLAAGQTLSAVAGQHASLFAQAGPIKAIAAAGPVSLQAHAGELELLADQDVTITATDARIEVLAQQKIVLQAGQSAITLEGGDITFACPGEFTVKASQHPFLGGESGDLRMSLPDGLVHLEPDRMLDFSG
jgi:type VI secretion system VgrG family protein